MATSREVCKALLQMIDAGKNPIDVFLGRGIVNKSAYTSGYYPVAPELDLDTYLLKHLGLSASAAARFAAILKRTGVNKVINPVNIYNAIVKKEIPNVSSVFLTSEPGSYDIDEALAINNGTLMFVYDDFVRGIPKPLNEISLAYLKALCRRVCEVAEHSAYGVSLVPSQDMLDTMRRINEYRERLQRMSTSALFDAARSKIPDQALRRALVEAIMDPSQFMD